jgi:hypothetical protein
MATIWKSKRPTVWLDAKLGLSRPWGDCQPRCSLCVAEIPPFDSEPLMLLHEVPTGRVLWIYCTACEPKVHALLGGGEDDR